MSINLHLWTDMHVVWHIYDAVPSVFGKCDDFEPGLTMLSPVWSLRLEYFNNYCTSGIFSVYFRLKISEGTKNQID